MTRITALTLVLTLAIGWSGCATTQRNAPLQPQALTRVEQQQVDALLDQLYRSFSYGNGEGPDWEGMRSYSVDGAQFVTERAAGEAPRPQSIDEFIASWRSSIRESTTPSVATEEWITDTRAVRVGDLIRLDLMFQAKKGNEASPRKPGLDSLLLVEADGEWKVLSFVVHYESKP